MPSDESAPPAATIVTGLDFIKTGTIDALGSGISVALSIDALATVGTLTAVEAVGLAAATMTGGLGVAFVGIGLVAEFTDNEQLGRYKEQIEAFSALYGQYAAAATAILGGTFEQVESAANIGQHTGELLEFKDSLLDFRKEPSELGLVDTFLNGQNAADSTSYFLGDKFSNDLGNLINNIDANNQNYGDEGGVNSPSIDVGDRPGNGELAIPPDESSNIPDNGDANSSSDGDEGGGGGDDPWDGDFEEF